MTLIHIRVHLDECAEPILTRNFSLCTGMDALSALPRIICAAVATVHYTFGLSYGRQCNVEYLPLHVNNRVLPCSKTNDKL